MEDNLDKIKKAKEKLRLTYLFKIINKYENHTK